MKETKQFDKQKTVLFLIFILNTFLLHLFLYDDYGDDLTVRGLLAPNLLTQLTELWKYNSVWSSRILVNPPIFIMLHFDYHVWILCDVLMLYLIFRGFIFLLGIKEVPDLKILLLVMLLYPLDASVNYGMIVMSITYIWPAAAGIWCLAFLRMHIDQKAIKWYQYVLFILANIYASNKEELSITLFIIYGAYSIYSFVKKHPSAFAVLQTIISTGSILFHMLYSGNQVRYEILSESIPYTFIDKAEIGLTSTFFCLLCRYDFLTILLFTLMAVCIWRKYNKFGIRLMSIILPVITILMSVLFFRNPKSIRDTDYAISYGKYNDMIEWFKLVVYLAVAALIIYEIYLIFRENHQFINMWILTLAGFCGRCAIGFGNKGWLTSFERTFTFFYLIMLYIIYHMIKKINENLSPKGRKTLIHILITLAVFSDLRIIYVLWW